MQVEPHNSSQTQAGLRAAARRRSIILSSPAPAVLPLSGSGAFCTLRVQRAIVQSIANYRRGNRDLARRP